MSCNSGVFVDKVDGSLTGKWESWNPQSLDFPAFLLPDVNAGVNKGVKSSNFKNETVTNKNSFVRAKLTRSLTWPFF